MEPLLLNLTFDSGDVSAVTGFDLHPYPHDALMKLFPETSKIGDTFVVMFLPPPT